jgi:4-diphosphocytidyl-2-C-methyl-D-erythritol kinase
MRRSVFAPAKINLFLRVVGRLRDGYHDIETVILPISFGDQLEITAAADPAGPRPPDVSFRVTGEPGLLRGVPRDESNLVLRGAAALAVEAGVAGSAEIVLDKRVPPAAGLGGGSADAAAALLALNELWRCGLDDDALRRVAARVGSDVPALIGPGPCVARGRGERVEPLAVAPLRWRLVTFGFGVSTADAFRWWDEDGAEPGPDPAGLLAAAKGGDPAALGPLVFNDLEGSVTRRHPEVRAARDGLLAAGAVAALMCGSGPTVSGLFATGKGSTGMGGVGFEVRSGVRVRT